jgi:hypothetical protein
MHFWVIERRRGGARDLNSAAAEPISTFAFGRGIDVVVVAVAGVPGGGPATSATVSGIALLGELAVDRRVTARKVLAHAQKLMAVAHAGNLQVSLPSAYIDYLF